MAIAWPRALRISDECSLYWAVFAAARLSQYEWNDNGIQPRPALSLSNGHTGTGIRKSPPVTAKIVWATACSGADGWRRKRRCAVAALTP